jgi:hypothetical protein
MLFLISFLVEYVGMFLKKEESQVKTIDPKTSQSPVVTETTSWEPQSDIFYREAPARRPVIGGAGTSNPRTPRPGESDPVATFRCSAFNSDSPRSGRRPCHGSAYVNLHPM